MRKGFPGLSLMVQETLKRDPMCGHLFVFRGRGSGLIKVTEDAERSGGIICAPQWMQTPTAGWLPHRPR